MIQSKKDLKFYIAADRIMNGLPTQRTLKEVLLNNRGGLIISYLRAMRHCAYYQNIVKNKFSIESLCRIYWWHRFGRLGLKLGFSIGPYSLGYGVVIPHYGTIVVNGDARIGNFSVLHTCTCVAGKKNIGDFFYLSSGSQVVGDITVGMGVTVGAHSLVNKSIGDNVLLVGTPAEVKKINYPLWVDRDGKVFRDRVSTVNEFQKKILG